ncbi:kinase-like protein, partial [Caulochytrium protostelioides]
MAQALKHGDRDPSTLSLHPGTSIPVRREFAIKILEKRHIIKQRKEKYAGVELAALLRLKHPLIVTLHFRFKDDERLYFVLEFAKNGDLLGWIRKLGSFDVPTARFYFAEILLATRYMHEQNVLHRDLKPENILIAEDFHIRVTD